MNRIVSRPWLIMALIFVLGIGTGVLLTIGLGPRFTRPMGEQEMRNRWMMHLSHRLNLTPDQQSKIRPILDEAEAQILSVHHEDVSRVSGILQAANSKISALLNPDQRAQLAQMEQEREKMFSGRMHGGREMAPPGEHPDGPPPPPPPGPPVAP